MNSLKTYIDALQDVSDNPSMIIMGDNPLCDTLARLLKAQLIDAVIVGKPEYITRIENCHITPDGALALFNWTEVIARHMSEQRQSSRLSRARGCLFLIGGIILSPIIIDAYTVWIKPIVFPSITQNHTEDKQR